MTEYYIDLPWGKFCFESDLDFNSIDIDGLTILRLNNYIDSEDPDYIKVLNEDLYEKLCSNYKWSEFVIKPTDNGAFFYIILDDSSFGVPSFKIYFND